MAQMSSKSTYGHIIVTVFLGLERKPTLILRISAGIKAPNRSLSEWGERLGSSGGDAPALTHKRLAEAESHTSGFLCSFNSSVLLFQSKAKLKTKLKDHHLENGANQHSPIRQRSQHRVSNPAVRIKDSQNIGLDLAHTGYLYPLTFPPGCLEPTWRASSFIAKQLAYSQV